MRFQFSMYSTVILSVLFTVTCKLAYVMWCDVMSVWIVTLAYVTETIDTIIYLFKMRSRSWTKRTDRELCVYLSVAAKWEPYIISAHVSQCLTMSQPAINLEVKRVFHSRPHIHLLLTPSPEGYQGRFSCLIKVRAQYLPVRCAGGIWTNGNDPLCKRLALFSLQQNSTEISKTPV